MYCFISFRLSKKLITKNNEGNFLVVLQAENFFGPYHLCYFK